MSHVALYQQPIKTRALVNACYGKAPTFVYYDGHSRGGRQDLKVAQERPELYDGYLIAQPAVSVKKFSLSNLYPQVVIKSAQGITAAEKPAATAKAVASCDRERLPFLLDPFGCSYNPLRDAGALCTVWLAKA